MGRMVRSCERLTVGSCQTLMMNLFTNNHLREKFDRRKIRSIKFFKGYLPQTFLSLEYFGPFYERTNLETFPCSYFGAECCQGFIQAILMAQNTQSSN